MNVREALVEISTPDGNMQAFEASPEGGARGAVIVLHGIEGVAPNMEVVCRVLAQSKLRVVAPALFHRNSLTANDMNAGLEEMLKKFEPDDNVLGDVDAAYDFLRSAGISPKRIAVLGFCWGGRAAFLVALRRSLSSCVTFYGTGIVEQLNPGALGMADLPSGLLQPVLVGDIPKMKTPWLGIFGDKDHFIPVEDVERLRSDLKASCPVSWDIVRYSDQGHAFAHSDITSLEDLRGDVGDAWGKAIDWILSRLE